VGNPRKGDVEAVARSYATFGQQKPVVVQRRGRKTVVIDGNQSGLPPPAYVAALTGTGP
jgi:hypothetical protein